MSVIVTVSGGKSSAYCAYWAMSNYPKKDVILYFNDTKWEHPDLYRFLNDLEKFLDHKITYDSDGRSPEQLFWDEHCLANNRMPFCSRILKAERLQKFYKDGDTIIFGIGLAEMHRAERLVQVYQLVAAKTGKFPNLRFPIIEEKVTSDDIDKFITDVGIEIPELYKLGFVHNNCSGGCVRAGKKHWRLVLEKLPHIYSERERVEEEFRNRTGKDVHFFKDETLKHYRERLGVGVIDPIDETEDSKEFECIGICETMA